MPGAPLAIRLKKAAHRSVAQAQDVLVSEVYSVVPQAVLHGGTAIWRCYRGNRFSEDVDFYHEPLNPAHVKVLLGGIQESGLETLKFRQTARAVFATFSYERSTVRYEAVNKQAPRHVLAPFEMFDGTYAMVNTLSPEDLIQEKAAAYAARRKVRDLYDVVFLLPYAAAGDPVRLALRNLLSGFKPPLDGGTLRTVIISGAVPRAADLVEALRTWAK